MYVFVWPFTNVLNYVIIILQNLFFGDASQTWKVSDVRRRTQNERLRQSMATGTVACETGHCGACE